MDPEVLFRSAADDPFECGVIEFEDFPLGVAGGEGAGVDDGFAELFEANPIAIGFFQAACAADEDDGVIAEGEEGDGAVGGGGFAEEVDELSLSAGILVPEHAEAASLFEDLSHAGGPAGFVDQFVVVSFAELLEPAVEERVIETAGDDAHFEAEEAEDLDGDFPVAVVAGEEDDGAIGEEIAEDVLAIGDFDDIQAVAEVQAGLDLADFLQQSQEMDPHVVDDAVAVRSGQLIAEGSLEIGLGDVVAGELAREEMTEHPGETAGESDSESDRHESAGSLKETEGDVLSPLSPSRLFRRGHSFASNFHPDECSVRWSSAVTFGEFSFLRLFAVAGVHFFQDDGMPGQIPFFRGNIIGACPCSQPDFLEQIDFDLKRCQCIHCDSPLITGFISLWCVKTD